MCYCEIICILRELGSSMSLRRVVSSQEVDTKLLLETQPQCIETWCLTYSQCSAIQCLRSLWVNDNKLDWEHNAKLVLYYTKCNSQTNQMLVICFALSGIPPWNNHQSQRLLNVSKRDITEPRWPERISFLTPWTAVPLCYSLQVNERPFLETETYSIYFFLPDCQA